MGGAGDDRRRLREGLLHRAAGLGLRRPAGRRRPGLLDGDARRQEGRRAVHGRRPAAALEQLRDRRVRRRERPRRPRRRAAPRCTSRSTSWTSGGWRSSPTRPAPRSSCGSRARQIGAQLVNAPGAMNWNDLITPDPDGAERFYGELFGWTFEEVPDIRRLPRDQERRAARTAACSRARTPRPAGSRTSGMRTSRARSRRSPGSAARCSRARSRCGRARSASSAIRRARRSRSGPATTT